MKVVMIGPFAFKPKGTVSARAFPIARILVARGHEVTILMPPYDNLPDSGKSWVAAGVRLENARVRRNDLFRQTVVPMALARRAVALRPDVVHVFKPVGYSGMAGVYLRCFARHAIVLDTDDWEGRGGWLDVNPYPRAWRRLFAWQEPWLVRHAGALTVASRTLQTQAWGLGVQPQRVVYVPNGPDPELRDRADVPASEARSVRDCLALGDAPFALYLGHIPHGTDLDLAIDALALVHQQIPTCHLVIAGSGDGLAELRRHAERAGVADRVRFPGWIEHEQAPLYLAAANVVVNPYRDTLINRSKCAGKVVAAMAMAKAVVTGRVGQNLEYIEDGRSGLLTEPGDAQDLAEKLLAVLRDPALASRLGQSARQRIWAVYAWELGTDCVERAYHVAIQRAKGRG